jgi:hypothetical protein
VTLDTDGFHDLRDPFGGHRLIRKKRQGQSHGPG